MKSSVKIAICVLIILILPSISTAGLKFQNNWSGGPGVTGPVTYWGNTFSTHTQIDWESLPGNILLLLNVIAHNVTGYMGNLHTGYAVDMDGDGDMDILSDSGYRALIAWFENNGTGGGWTRHDVSSTGEILYPRACYPADMDGDGDLDVIGAENSSTYDRIYLWLNTDGNGTVWDTQIIADDLYSLECIYGDDMDGDGDNDIIAGDDGPDGQIIWYENQDISDPWPAHVVSSAPHCYDLHTVDIDQDGDIDILSANWWINNELNLWENVDGTGDSWTRYKICNNIGVATSVCTGDIDGDLNIDIVSAGYGDDARVSWFENPDSIQGTWIEHVLQYQFYGGQAVHELDFDGDGDVDVLGAAGNVTPPPVGLYELFLWENLDGMGNNWIRHSLDSGSWYKYVDVADIDGDDTLDVISFSSVGSIINWYRLEYANSGLLVSSILDVVGYPQWDSISWTGEEPPGTDLFYQLKGSNEWENMGVWCDTIFEPSSLAGYIDSTYRYLQYRVGMTSDIEFLTPVLDEVRLYWSAMGIEGGEESQGFSITAVPNPSGSEVSIEVPPVYAEYVELLVYDLSGKLVRKITERNGNTFIWDGHDSSGHEAPSGNYIIRGIAPNRSASVRFVKL